MTIYGYNLAEGLRRRGHTMVCSVCTVYGNADIDTGWRLERLDLGSNLGFHHFTVMARVRVRVMVRVKATSA